MISFILAYFVALLVLWKIILSLTKGTSYEGFFHAAKSERVPSPNSVHEGPGDAGELQALEAQIDAADNSELRKRHKEQLQDSDVRLLHIDEERCLKTREDAPLLLASIPESLKRQDEEITEEAEFNLRSTLEVSPGNSNEEIQSEIHGTHLAETEVQATVGWPETRTDADTAVVLPEKINDIEIIDSDSGEVLSCEVSQHHSSPQNAEDFCSTETTIEEPCSLSFDEDLEKIKHFPSNSEVSLGLNEGALPTSIDLEKNDHYAKDLEETQPSKAGGFRMSVTDAGINVRDDQDFEKLTPDTQRTQIKETENDYAKCDLLINDNEENLQTVTSDVINSQSETFRESEVQGREDNLITKVLTYQATDKQTFTKSLKSEQMTVIKKHVTFKDPIANITEDDEDLCSESTFSVGESDQNLSTETSTNASETTNSENSVDSSLRFTTVTTSSRTEVRKTSIKSTTTSSQKISYSIIGEDKSEKSSELKGNILSSLSKGKPIGGISLFGNDLASELKIKLQQKKMESEASGGHCETEEEDLVSPSQVEEIPNQIHQNPGVHHSFFLNSEAEAASDFDDPIRESGLTTLTKDRPKPPQRRKPQGGIGGQPVPLQGSS